MNKPVRPKLARLLKEKGFDEYTLKRYFNYSGRSIEFTLNKLI